MSENSAPDRLTAASRVAKRQKIWQVRRHSSHDETKTAEYAYWQGRTTEERMAAVSDLTTELYAMKGQDVSRLQRVLVRAQRS